MGDNHKLVEMESIAWGTKNLLVCLGALDCQEHG
jgi:hypothetical protein